jgi:uncharacterized protein
MSRLTANVTSPLKRRANLRVLLEPFDVEKEPGFLHFAAMEFRSGLKVISEVRPDCVLPLSGGETCPSRATQGSPSAQPPSRALNPRESLFWPLLLLAAALLAGCQKSPPPVAPPPPEQSAQPQHPYLDHAQNDLPVIKVWVGSQELDTEVCLTSQQLATGMMFRTNLPETSAMLFPFPAPHRAAFYMKNTTVPLSAAYIDPDGVVLELHDFKPLEESPVEAASDRIQYVLEVKQGWFARHGVSTGAVVRTPQGPLRQKFTFGSGR